LIFKYLKLFKNKKTSGETSTTMLGIDFREDAYPGIYIYQILYESIQGRMIIEKIESKKVIEVISILGYLKNFDIDKMIEINGWETVVKCLTDFVGYITDEGNIIHVSKYSVCRRTWVKRKNWESFYNFRKNLN